MRKSRYLTLAAVALVLSVGVAAGASAATIPCHSAAVCAVQNGDMSAVLNGFLADITQLSQKVSALFTGQAGIEILAGCAAIRILAVVLPGVLDGDMSALMKDGMVLAVTVTIILALFGNWTSGYNLVDKLWSGIDGLASGVTEVASVGQGSPPAVPTSGDPLPALGTWVATQAKTNIDNVSTAVWGFTHPPGNMSGAEWAAYKLFGSVPMFFVAIAMVIACVVCVAFVYISLFMELVMSWAHVVLALTFGPLALAFYPLKPDWGKAVVKEVATGAMTMLCVLFLLCVANHFTTLSTDVIAHLANVYASG